MLFDTFLWWCVLCQERCQKIAPSISKDSLCRSWHGGGDKIPREQIQRSEQFVPPKWHHRGDRIGEFFQRTTRILAKSIYLISDDTIVCWPLTLKRGLCVSDHTGHVSQPFNHSPAYLAHTNPISLPILSWHRDYQHTWPPSSVLSRTS